MYFTGFADEVSGDIERQIAVTKALGWENIEARSIEGRNITDISDQKFDEVYRKLQAANVKINCFGSAVANWGKSPTSEQDFQRSIEELKRAIPRMQKLGTKMIRGMSFSIPEEDSPKLEEKVIEKLKVMVGLCEEAEILYLHENCMNYFSQSYEHMDRLISKIDSPYFKIVFDTGNPVFSDNRVGDPPYKKQNSWEAYQHLKDKIAYIHIKDGIFLYDVGKTKFTFPGEGDGQVKRILKDLLVRGYDGGISIEPHMGSVYHEQADNVQTPEEYKYNVYVEYGKRLMKMVADIRNTLS
ncbi:MAG: sugar phosphate isomerase/epimerase [Firmicutes bacterium]|nr:sugar phosphate isomerase/epimerase [Bacillota bacterium]